MVQYKCEMRLPQFHREYSHNSYRIYIMNISREKLNLEVVKYLKNGGKITKLPDGPDYRFQPYGVRVTPGDPKVDLTITDTPTTKQQISYVEKNAL